MCGLPFAGKSTAAAELSNEIGARIVSIDEIKTSLDLRDVWEEMAADDWAQIFEKAAALTTEELRNGRSVIYDSTNHTRAGRDVLRKLAQDAGAIARVVFVDTSVEAVESRWRSNRTHKDRMDLSEWALRRALEDYEPPRAEDDVVEWRSGDGHGP